MLFTSCAPYNTLFKGDTMRPLNKRYAPSSATQPSSTILNSSGLSRCQFVSVFKLTLVIWLTCVRLLSPTLFACCEGVMLHIQLTIMVDVARESIITVALTSDVQFVWCYTSWCRVFNKSFHFVLLRFSS